MPWWAWFLLGNVTGAVIGLVAGGSYLYYVWCKAMTSIF